MKISRQFRVVRRPEGVVSRDAISVVNTNGLPLRNMSHPEF
jgi:hypothetical protein